jgi:methyltransferase (TIGR00027 family)
VRAKPSRTAQAVAAERAVLTDLGVLDDPFARELLGPAISIVYRIVRRWPHAIPTLPVTLAGLAARVRWHDGHVADALGDGITQVAVIGAGYDSRAWRFARDGVSFFELDHPATQTVKASVAPPAGPVYVAADLRSVDAAEALRRAGLDPEAPAIHVVEGVTMYLAEDVVRRQLSALAEASAPGSRLTIDFYPPSDVGTAGDRRQHRVQRLGRSGSGEDLRLLIDRDGAVELVTSCGWAVAEVVSAREAARRLVPAESGLPRDRVNEHKTAVFAVVRG